jgi:hypothetical protein
MISQNELILQTRLPFYSNPKYFTIFLEIVHLGKHISLRLLDFFATNYAYMNRVWINGVNISNDYKQHLKGVKKRYFDPFCRNSRIYILKEDETNEHVTLRVLEPKEFKQFKDHPDKTIIVTTVGQLNFFRWCIQRDIITYIIKNYTKIEKAMTESNYTKKQNFLNYNKEQKQLIQQEQEKQKENHFNKRDLVYPKTKRQCSRELRSILPTSCTTTSMQITLRF